MMLRKANCSFLKHLNIQSAWLIFAKIEDLDDALLALQHVSNLARQPPSPSLTSEAMPLPPATFQQGVPHFRYDPNFQANNAGYYNYPTNSVEYSYPNTLLDRPVDSLAEHMSGQLLPERKRVETRNAAAANLSRQNRLLHLQLKWSPARRGRETLSKNLVAAIIKGNALGGTIKDQ